MKHWGVADAEVATYVGFLASAFFAAQAISTPFWGKASEKWGRRPTLLSGLLGTSVSMLLFAFAPNLATALLARFLTGFLNGNVAISKTYMAEITDSTNAARGFSILSFNWGLGMIIAPALGGFLADPATKYPDTIFATVGVIFQHFLNIMLL